MEDFKEGVSESTFGDVNAVKSVLTNSDYQLQGDINYLLSAITEKNKQ